MSEVHVRHMGPREYAVEVSESHPHGRAPAATSTHHRVRVDDRLLDDLPLLGPDRETEETVVRESFDFLLEREPATSIRRAFDLSEISDYFPDYLKELRTRLP